MRRFLVAVLALALATSAWAVRGGQGLAEMVVEPAVTTSPITPDAPVMACVNGLAPGSVITIAIPWVSNDGVRVSRLSFTDDVDETGGLCVHAPPDWTTLRLVPGVYTVISRTHSSRKSDDGAPGPSATLTIVE